jgi:AraC-like DNA-binding protein
LAKIAAELEHALASRREHGTAGCTSARVIAGGHGWTVADVVCTSGPGDRPFEEQHAQYTIAVVLAGSFQYRSTRGPELMTPGSLMLGNSGQCFECGHAHGEGDRCVSFWYSPDYFERLAFDVGMRSASHRSRGASDRFTVPRLPPLRHLSPLVMRAALGVAGSVQPDWEELGMSLAARTVRLARGLPSHPGGAPPNAEAHVTRAVRTIDRHPEHAWTLSTLAQNAGLSRYHFLRTFNRLTGVTPHQYILRARLREAAVRLVRQPGSVLDVAFDCGFGDVSNFTRAFRAEFAVSPREYRKG